jgi:beta-galactosidase
MPLLRTHATVFVASLLCACSAAAQSPRLVIPLDTSWRFREGETPAASATAFDDTTWSSVSVPHVFTPQGTGNKRSNYLGEAWYRRPITPPASWQGKRIFLRFDAVSLVSDVYLNGEKLGEHRGGFSAFTYEITGKLKLGVLNELSVRVDDRMNQEVAPIEPSLLHGGIYRPVSLIVTGPVDITPTDYSSPGVYLIQSAVTAEQAVVKVQTLVNSNLSGETPVSVRLLLIDGAGKPMFKTTATGPVPGGAKDTAVTQVITIPKPHLWNGVADPYLYTVRIDLLDDKNTVLDTVYQPLGLRFFHVDPKKGFLLNGIAQQLHGVCLHQDYGDMGWAVTPVQEKEDLQILREMGADALRLVHYPHSQSALDLYDRTGMIVWSELPQFGQVGLNQAYKDNIRQQLIEMIRQNYNHPSIVMWSLYNELTSRTKLVSGPIVEDLNKLAHKEDPTRYTVGASHGDMTGNEHDTVAIPDLIAINDYPGWYFGSPQDMGADLEKDNASFDGRGLAVSEYGAGAKPTDHKQGFHINDVKPVDVYGYVQPEEWEALVHEGAYAEIKKRPFVWGSFVWLAFDTGGTLTDYGVFEGANIKGLVTQDRKVRKDAYFFYQANWTTKPMLYLTDRRFVNRTDASTPVKVYSNAATVTLKVNGKDYGAQTPNDVHVFIWPKIELQPGDNKVEVSTLDGLHDEATWNLKAGAAK